MSLSSPKRVLARSDLPTLGRPTMAIFINSGSTETGGRGGKQAVAFSNNSSIPLP